MIKKTLRTAWQLHSNTLATTHNTLTISNMMKTTQNSLATA